MKIISFTWTTPALLAGAKTVTRRGWKPEYAARFKAGDFILAYDRSPRVHGMPVALLRLTRTPYFERVSQMPDSDFEAEGLKALGWTRQMFEQWRGTTGALWVVRFEVIELWPGGKPLINAKAHAEQHFRAQEQRDFAGLGFPEDL